MPSDNHLSTIIKKKQSWLGFGLGIAYNFFNQQKSTFCGDGDGGGCVIECPNGLALLHIHVIQSPNGLALLHTMVAPLACPWLLHWFINCFFLGACVIDFLCGAIGLAMVVATANVM